MAGNDDSIPGGLVGAMVSEITKKDMNYAIVYVANFLFCGGITFYKMSSRKKTVVSSG